MKFFNIFKSVFEDKSLKKVRIKVDPVWAEKLGALYSPNYEGYILQECHDSGGSQFKIFIVNVPPGYNPIQTVSSNNIEEIPQDKLEEVPQVNYSRLTLLKKAILDKVIEKGKTKDDPDVLQLLNSKDIGFIETFLRQMGLTEEDILNLYRKCFKKL